MSSSISNEKSINKRYVQGLKIAAITLFGLYLMGVSTAIILPGLEAPFTRQVLTFLFLGGLLIYGSVAVFVNESRYSICLFLAVFMQMCFPIAIFFILNYEYSFAKFPELMGGRIMDYAFIGAAGPMVVSVMFARFYLSLFLIFYVLAITIFQIFAISSTPELFFSFNYNEIATNINAINGQVLFNNSTYLIVVTAGLITLAWVIDRNLKEATLQERSNNLLGRYFSPEVREEIESSKLDFNQTLEKEQNIAVMFTDISNFTKLSEGLEPKQVLELLSEYQTKMVAAVFQNGGSVDKFIGDSVMATFGTPVSRGNDAQNALNCIRRMQISMREWEKERSENNLPVIKHRIGVHYGSCFVGNVGSEDRVEFTVIGDTVNVASRICEACKEIKSEVLISDEVKLRLSENLPTEQVKNFEVRGRNKKVTLHKLIV